MDLFVDILRLGWPLWLGLPWTAAWASRLREEAAATSVGDPPEIMRTMLFFAEGDVLRALVLLEGETHPLCMVLSGFWKGIAAPRQWDGIALIAESQRRLPGLLGHLGRARVWVQGTGLVTIALTLGWLLFQRAIPPSPGFTGTALATAEGSVLVMLLAFTAWWLLVISTELRRLRDLAVRAQSVLHQSIEALDHGRLSGGLGQPRPQGALTPGTPTRPRNIVADTYKR